MKLLLAMVLLAQTPDHWVMFEVCQMDLKTVPPTMMRARDHTTFNIRADRVTAVGNIRLKHQGLECSELHTTTRRTVYIIGTPEQIMRKLNRE